MLENAGGQGSWRLRASCILSAVNGLAYSSQPSPDRREGWKCKDRACWCEVFSDQLELAANLSESSKRLVEVVSGVRRRNLAAHTGLALGYDRVAESRYEDTLGQEEIAHADGCGCLSENNWNDGCLSRKRLETSAKQLISEVASVIAQRHDALGVCLEILDTGQ